MSIGKKLKLYAKVKKYQCKQQLKAFRHSSSIIEMVFLLYSFFSNPFRVNNLFYKRTKKNGIHTYGETSFSAFQTLKDILNLKKGDTFYDLGCGRGKLCFWVACKSACQVQGWDWNPTFVSRANRLKRLLGIYNLTFACRDFTKEDLSAATCIYLFGLFLSDDQIIDLQNRFSSLKSGTRLVCVSFPFSSELFVSRQTFLFSFPWGKAKAYLQIKK